MTTSLPAAVLLLSAFVPLAHAQLQRSQADIGFASSDTTASLVIAPSSGPPGGCWSGYTFIAARGGCVRGRTEYDRQYTSCPASYRGQQVRTRQRDVYSHQQGQTTTGAWSGWSGWQFDCTYEAPPPRPEPPPPARPPGPAVGTTFVVAGNLICNMSDADYGWSIPYTPSAWVRDGLRLATIFAYKALPSQRCPEAGNPVSFTASYPYWIDQLGKRLRGVGLPQESERELGVWIYAAVKAAGAGETLSMMDTWCQSAADARWGAGRSRAVFIRRDEAGYTGRDCRVSVSY